LNAPTEQAQHPSAKTILLTGATGGIGLAIARRQLSSSDEHLLILTGRNVEVLQQFEREYPDRARAVQCDMADLGKVAGLVRHYEVHERLDALILNHGTLGNCLRVAQMEGNQGEEWQRVFTVNVTSCVAMVSLRLYGIHVDCRVQGALLTPWYPCRSARHFPGSDRLKDALSSPHLGPRRTLTRLGERMAPQKQQSTTSP
jgi:NAD(P)-dependent dehydrogenase (short-subunit alcohol dehydrogenase family)